MKLKRVLLLVGVFALLMVVAYSIYAVLSMSNNQIRDQMIQSIGNAEGRDTHMAVGNNILNDNFDYVINNDATLQEVVSSHDVTVVNFFASWCLPCQREVPELNELHKEINGSDAAIIAINVDDTVDGRDKFIEEHNVLFPVYEFHDEDAGLDEFKVSVIPTTFFVDGDGEIIRVFIGEVNLDLLNNYISYVKELD
ncbi:TlpA family protein disulfide reductase [Aliicoccus persicus]|uniref:Thiol-disulfide isomerase or thioredoxin n=1 Tax=Aliicoccus persicus TaxID=930138 RepID=A0A662Z6N0_9STAP|nr:TlpA disulfide reductase family protein [Aliicoccus persicus]SEW00512.1 Thiol-disulfide isomerase or thioredoxin [Aliicoccus persicus]